MNPILVPDDEELFVEELAAQVAEDARPLFEIAWLWLGRRALELDDNEP